MQGWDIDAENIEICRDSKGEPWLLGEGSYGKVRRCNRSSSFSDPACLDRSALVLL